MPDNTFRANAVPGFNQKGQFDFSSYSSPNDSTFFGTPHFDGSNAAQAGVNALSNAFPGLSVLAGLGQGFNLFGQAPPTGNKIADIAGTSGVLQNGVANASNWLNRLLGGTYMPDSQIAPTLSGPSPDGGQGWNQAVQALRDGQAPMGSSGYSIEAPQQVGLRNEPSYAPMGAVTDPSLPVLGGMDNGRSQSVQAQQNAIIDLQSGKYDGLPLHFDNTQAGWTGQPLQNLGGADAYNSIGMTPFAAFGSPDNGGQGSGPSAEDVKRWSALNSTGNQWLD